MVKWHPSDANFIKINFDASVQHNRVAIGFVFRDSDGNPITVAARFIWDAPVLLVEITALKEALHSAWLQQFSHVLIEGDSTVLINCLNGKAATPWCIRSLIQDIQ